MATVGTATRDRIIVRISATNLGIRPIAWDNEFAALINWNAWIGTDIDYPATKVHEQLQRPMRSLPSSRFSTLQPGEKVAKDVDLVAGIRMFGTGHGTIASPEGAYGHTPIAYEAIQKFWIPEKANPISVVAIYDSSSPDALGGDTFKLYFGRSIKDTGLPEGFFQSNRLVIQIQDR